MRRLLVSFSDPGKSGRSLAILDPASKSGNLAEVPLPYSSFGLFSILEAGGKLQLALTGASAQKPSEVAVLEVDSVDSLLTSSPEDWKVLRKATNLEVRLPRN